MFLIFPIPFGFIPFSFRPGSKAIVTVQTLHPVLSRSPAFADVWSATVTLASVTLGAREGTWASELAGISDEWETHRRHMETHDSCSMLFEVLAF